MKLRLIFSTALIITSIAFLISANRGSRAASDNSEDTQPQTHELTKPKVYTKAYIEEFNRVNHINVEKYPNNYFSTSNVAYSTSHPQGDMINPVAE